ncbi:MAG: outer membrane protein assembly factor BamA [Ignavibacteria bacterium]|nr:outer membrane protein assembly factor BamA [Ignavibacteria bacterium]
MLSIYNKKAIFFFILIAFSTFSLFGQTKQEKQRIAGISVEGNVFADKQTILTLSGLKESEEITIPIDTKVQSALKNLWARKQFSDVEIKIEKTTPQGVFLVIIVKELPRLSHIQILGNEKVKSDDIRKAAKKGRGDLFSKYDIYLIKQRIKNLYSEEGLFYTKIETELEQTDTAHYMTLIVRINEGVQYYVKSINFTGNEHFSGSDLAGAFDDTKTKAWWQFWRSSKFDMNKYKEDKVLLENYFKKNGFIDAVIIRDSLRFNEETEELDIDIEVFEGNRYYVRNIVFKGNTIYPTEILMRRLDFSSGSVYNVEQFEMNLKHNQDQTDAASLYADNGYLFANLETEEIRVATDSVDIIVTVVEGTRVSIRKVIVEGNTKTKDKVIRRELYTHPGDFFNRSAIIQSVKALGVLNYFNQETIRPDVRMVDNTKVDVVYKVEERSTDTFNASIGLAGSYGLTGAIGFTFNNFAIEEPLKGGGGQILNFSWEFGQANRIQNINLGFSEPWLFDAPTTVGFNIFDSRINYYMNLRRTGVALNLGRRFKWPDNYFRGDWNLVVQRNDVGDEYTGSYYRPGLSTEITLGQTLSRSSVDNLFFPTSGSRFSFSTQLAMGAIGLGTTDYFKNQFKFEISHPLYFINEYPRLVLFLGSHLGYITGFKSDTTFNPIELYYMGGNGLSGLGITPLRGYEDQSVGPNKGGTVMSKYTAELRFAISLEPMPVYLYAFAEAGNVWSDLKNTDPFNLKRSSGLGLQILFNPFGLIGFSYGYGFDKSDLTGEVSGWRFLFHLGQ